MKSRISILGVLVVVAAACGGHETTPPPATQPPAAAAPATTAPAASGAAEFGVPECDDYLKKYMACIDSHVPEAGRAMMRQQLDQTKEQWKQAAATAEGRSALGVGCKAAMDAARTATAAYGCTF
jgi:hypothetical protein